MDSQSPFKKQYEAILADKKKNPEMSYAAVMAKRKASGHQFSEQGFWIYKRKLEAAAAEIKREPGKTGKAPTAPKPTPSGPIKEITIKVPADEAVDAFRKHKKIIINPDRILNALGDTYETFCRLLGEADVAEANKAGSKPLLEEDRPRK